MNVPSAAGILAVLHILVMAVLIGMATYALILVLTFLRLRIAVLKRAAPPAGDSGRP
jgi:hypothetical protein